MRGMVRMELEVEGKYMKIFFEGKYIYEKLERVMGEVDE
jgi:DNA polymerase elongation subunit (family B)